MNRQDKQNGSILIMVLWMVAMSITMVSFLLQNTRLSATIVMKQQEALNDWADILSSVEQAKMELLLDKINNSKSLASLLQNAGKQESDKKIYRFNGQEITLSYPQAEHIGVRISDLSGKINIRQLKRDQFKKLLEKQLGTDSKEIEQLLDAWQDWTDGDSLKRLNGAEKSYYQSNKYNYEPRNAPFESVMELRLVRGFDEAFKGVDLTQVFTLYGRSRQINPNIASKQALLIIPGIDEEKANEIILKRQTEPFKNKAEFRALFEPAEVNKVEPWIGFNQSRYYAITVYNKEHLKSLNKARTFRPEDQAVKRQAEDSDANNEASSQASNNINFKQVYVYQEVVQYMSNNAIPRTIRVFPAKRLELASLEMQVEPVNLNEDSEKESK